MDNKPVWTHTQFAKFFKKSPRLAYEYRKKALGYEIPEEYLTEEEKTAKFGVISNDITFNDTTIKENEKTSIIEDKKEDILENTEKSSNIEFTREYLIEKLEKAGVKVHPATKDDTLLKKAIENNLI